MAKYRVVGDQEIAGATKGETVDLDPEHVNIPALLAGGHIEEIKSGSGTKTSGSADSGSDKRSGTRKGADE